MYVTTSIKMKGERAEQEVTGRSKAVRDESE